MRQDLSQQLIPGAFYIERDDGTLEVHVANRLEPVMAYHDEYDYYYRQLTELKEKNRSETKRREKAENDLALLRKNYNDKLAARPVATNVDDLNEIAGNGVFTHLEHYCTTPDVTKIRPTAGSRWQCAEIKFDGSTCDQEWQYLESSNEWREYTAPKPAGLVVEPIRLDSPKIVTKPSYFKTVSIFIQVMIVVHIALVVLNVIGFIITPEMSEAIVAGVNAIALGLQAMVARSQMNKAVDRLAIK